MTDTENTEQQQPLDELQQLKDIARTHGVPIALGLLIVTLVFAVKGAYLHKTKTARAEASVMFANAQLVQDLEAKARQMGDVISQYSSTPSAPLALLALAKAYFDEEKSDIALSKYESFKKNYPDHVLAVGAELGRLHCLEALGSTDEALRGFTAFVEQNKDHFLTPQARLGMARCLMALGSHDNARVVCEDLIAGRPDTLWATEAEILLQQITDAPKRATRATVLPPIETPMPPVEITTPIPIPEPPETTASTKPAETEKPEKIEESVEE